MTQNATVFWARLSMLCLTLILGIVLFAYGSRLGDSCGADCSAFALMQRCSPCSRLGPSS